LLVAQNDRLEYFPMHVGDEWKYAEFTYDFMTGDTSEILGIVHYKIVGDTIRENGEKYFIFQRHFEENGPLEFYRIDTTGMKVYRYAGSSSRCDNYEIDMYYLQVQPDSQWIDCSGQNHLIEFDTSLVNEFNFTSPKIIDFPFWGIYLAYTLTKGLGLTVLEIGSIGQTSFEYLVYAKIDDKIYESITSLKIPRSLNSTYFHLNQNYPNPFNSETFINFSIPKPGFISLKIFDIAGREVETLIEDHMLSGNHKVKWNANNRSSGVYFYKLHFEDIIKTRKLLLVK
jgi:hypothetical protein